MFAILEARATRTTCRTRIGVTRAHTHVGIGSILFRSLARPVPAQSVSHYVFRGIWILRGILERCISSGPKLCAVRRRRANGRGNHAARKGQGMVSREKGGTDWNAKTFATTRWTRVFTQRPLTNDVFAIIIRASLLARSYIFLAFSRSRFLAHLAFLSVSRDLTENKRAVYVIEFAEFVQSVSP